MEIIFKIIIAFSFDNFEDIFINKDRMVHIYAAQYFLVTSYWQCPTDRVWSKFLSLIHPAIIKELSRKDFGLALQTIISESISKE